MRLGVYGGTFDPVHVGHLLLAEACREACQLDRVLWLPAGNPPHKQERELTAERLRSEMVRAAIAGHEQFQLDRRESRREGPSYTVETLSDIQAEFSDAELFFLMGGDSLAELAGWRDPAGILARATVVVAGRANASPPDLVPLVNIAGVNAAERVRFVTMPEIGVSSRDIRRRVAEGQSIRYHVPRAVECLIREHNLYGPNDSAGQSS
jgi:nicotinate-nucleotide adenylyltransferase